MLLFSQTRTEQNEKEPNQREHSRNTDRALSSYFTANVLLSTDFYSQKHVVSDGTRSNSVGGVTDTCSHVVPQYLNTHLWWEDDDAEQVSEGAGGLKTKISLKFQIIQFSQKFHQHQNPIRVTSDQVIWSGPGSKDQDRQKVCSLWFRCFDVRSQTEVKPALITDQTRSQVINRWFSPLSGLVL